MTVAVLKLNLVYIFSGPILLKCDAPHRDKTRVSGLNMARCSTPRGCHSHFALSLGTALNYINALKNVVAFM